MKFAPGLGVAAAVVFVFFSLAGGLILAALALLAWGLESPKVNSNE